MAAQAGRLSQVKATNRRRPIYVCVIGGVANGATYAGYKDAADCRHDADISHLSQKSSNCLSSTYIHFVVDKKSLFPYYYSEAIEIENHNRGGSG